MSDLLTLLGLTLKLCPDFDGSTNSIGWFAVSLDADGEPCGVLDMGVRIFPDGRKPTDKTSKAVDRL